MDPHAWPLVEYDRCEDNYAVVPFIAEFFSAITGVVLMAGGGLALFTSRYSDDLLDLVSATLAMNGVFSFLSHATLLRFFGRADALSINMGIFLYAKCMMLATCPTIARRPMLRGMVDLFVVCMMCTAVAWSKDAIPPAIFSSVDASTMFILACCPTLLVGMIVLAYGRGSWHMGRPKRVFLRAQVSAVLGTCAWVIDGVEGIFPCPSPISLHCIWHVFVAHAVLSWTAFLKFHRGLFLGFRVELRGRWWCPYTVWLEPICEPERHPIVRHAASPKKAAQFGGRRNTYLAAKFHRPTGRKTIAQVWRGESFYRPHGLLRKTAGGDMRQHVRRRGIVAKTSDAPPDDSEAASSETCSSPGASYPCSNLAVASTSGLAAGRVRFEQAERMRLPLDKMKEEASTEACTRVDLGHTSAACIIAEKRDQRGAWVV